jgi:hypothetical protein
MNYIKIKSFEVKMNYIFQDEKNKNQNIIHLEFIINDKHMLLYPCYEENLKEILNNFNDIIKGKNKTITLLFNENYNFLKFEKNFIEFSLLNETNKNNIRINQEFKMIFENNNIVRNGLRNFILKYNL